MKQLPPKQPRRKKAKSRGPKITNYSLPDAKRISKKIPAAIKTAIASAIMAFSEMEGSAETIIWDLSGVSMDDGILLTANLDAKEKLELTKKFSERYGIPIHANPEITANIWAAIRLEVEKRNKIAHGMWVMIDKKIPLAVSYRIKTGLGRVMGEEFPKERLKLMAVNCWKIKRIFDRMAQHIASLPTRPVPPPQMQTPSHPERPLTEPR
jgi:hypothetical protein